MADYLKMLELPRLAVESRIRFLADRANAHRQKAQHIESQNDWPRIALFSAAGTCLAQAAQLAFLSGDDADELLQQSAQDYLHAGLPYGLFLQAIYASDEDAAGLLFNSPAGNWLSQLDYIAENERVKHERPQIEILIPPHLAATNQQLYLCFAMVSVPDVARKYSQSLKRLIRSLRSHANLPHGAQGQPLQVQLEIIEPILNMILDDQPNGNVERPIRAISRLARHYSESIEAARRNSYLWNNLWAPVEYLDLEIVAAATCLARTGHVKELDKIAEHERFAGIPLLIASERRKSSGLEFEI